MQPRMITKASHTSSLCTALLTEPTLWARFVVSQDMPPLCTELYVIGLYDSIRSTWYSYEFMQGTSHFFSSFLLKCEVGHCFSVLKYFLLSKCIVSTINWPFVGLFQYQGKHLWHFAQNIALFVWPTQHSNKDSTNGVSLGRDCLFVGDERGNDIVIFTIYIVTPK